MSNQSAPNQSASLDATATNDESHPAPAADGGAPRSKRKLVLFADGTGNAFTKQESSVWRLYEALDHTQPDQISYYIKGVGTSGWAPLAAVDGATGIGVPSNVRKLYRFLCWNWQPGDEIYVFGFSRGAFTARTLAAMIASQGLVPTIIDKDPVSHAEMQRNTMAAWREYRRASVPWRKSLPTIWVARAIRDAALGLWHRILRHRSYADVRKAMDGRCDVNIEFLGLFDTVEAFGVPVEELRTAIDWAIWPISFRNHRLSDKVNRARHALSLDDERTTFHPLRFDQSHLKDPEQIKEVWFAGVHSDIGGGYPESTLSFVPLVWMASQIEKDLRFQPGTIEHFRAYQSAIGPMHDSRSGAAVFYRYGPRPIDEGEENGGPPVVHLSVVERMLHGCDDYAPIMLPASAKVLLPDGRVLPLTEDTTREAMKSAYWDSAKDQNARSAKEAEAFTAMSPPSAEMAQMALDTVWWRRVAYFSLLGMAAVLAAWPWIARAVVGSSKAHGLEGTTTLAVISRFDYGVSAVVGSAANFLKGVLPSYAAPWFDIAMYYPFLTSVVVIVALLTWHMNAVLRDRIQERARLAWDRPDRRVNKRDIGGSGLLLKIGRWMRLHGGPVRIVVTKVMVPFVFLVAVFGSALFATGLSYFNWRDGTGQFCRSQRPPIAVGDKPIAAEHLFDVSNFCWPSGLWVEKDHKYSVWVEIEDPWFDHTVMAGVNGFKTPAELAFQMGVPILRVHRADWFQPVIRIGEQGSNELPLQAVNVMPADELPRRRNPTVPADKATYPVRVENTAEFNDARSELRRNWRKFGIFEPIPAEALPAARDAWRKQDLVTSVVGEFVAPVSGEVFLYVNDAIQVLPFLGPSLLYKNNSGSAHVQIQRMPAPTR